jgi:hypothetical protein
VSVSKDNEAVTDEVTHSAGVDETSTSHEPHPRAICGRQDGGDGFARVIAKWMR